MDHAEARELIEEAALEPGGLDRMMAGDTPIAVALAGHLAGCPDCARDLAVLRRTVEALRIAAAESPSSDLRERTLSLVASVGRTRGAAAGSGQQAPGDGAARGDRPRPSGRRVRVLAMLGAAAVFALLAAASFVAADLQGQLDQTRAEAAHLRELYAEVEALLQQPGARLVALRASDTSVAGALLVDTTSNRLAVLSDDLPEPPAGMEYRCWVEVSGQREAVGRMWFEGGLAYWAGGAVATWGWPSGGTFGVSLEVIDQPASGTPVLSGDL